MRCWSMITPPEPDDLTVTWDRMGEQWDRTGAEDDQHWMSAYSGILLTWHELVTKYGPISDSEIVEKTQEFEIGNAYGLGQLGWPPIT